MGRYIRAIYAAPRAYTHHPDPRVAAANTLALVVAANQPFYPLYLYGLLDGPITPVWFTFLSTPFFLAVPAAGRWNPAAGRALLPVAGIGNSILCAWLFGTGSGVEVFLIPSATIALLLFRPPERWIGLAIAGAAFAAFLLLGPLYGAPLVAYAPADQAALVRINGLSAAMLTALAALLFSRLAAEAEGSGETVRGEKAG